MISVNERAFKIAKEMSKRANELNIKSHRLRNDSTVIDCGINASGSYAAGALFIKACMGGLVTVAIRNGVIKGKTFSFVDVATKHAAIACLGSQKAGWKIEVGDYVAMGSGPARALAKKPRDVFERIRYEDDCEYGVIALESNRLPDERVTKNIANACGITPANLTALVAPASSLVGSIQISGRVVETALHKLDELRYDTTKILHASGVAPIAPVMGDEMATVGATNDSIIYYGSVVLTVDEFDEIFEKLPSECSSDYGGLFCDILRDARGDFYKIDPNVFAPAEVRVKEVKSRREYHFGRLNADVLMRSYGVG
ncbi:MAG: methenyltetrahydromethanopterin cyclohydrolase [Methanocellales archaeon]|nr:methenyltetrahydromethanopterin cyclohydrolase [Methanocellales archaeon]